jgi:hypothetical protein
MTIISDDCQLRKTLENLLNASDELASAIELSSERFDTGLLDDIGPSKRELVVAANAARKILNAGITTKPDITKKAIAANIEALRQLLADAAITASEAFEAIEVGEQDQAIGAILGLENKLEDALALFGAAVYLHRAGRTS